LSVCECVYAQCKSKFTLQKRDSMGVQIAKADNCQDVGCSVN